MSYQCCEDYINSNGLYEVIRVYEINCPKCGTILDEKELKE